MGQGDAVLHMADDDQGAQGRFELVVTIVAGLVFDEVVRLEHLADVVKVAADADQQMIGPDGLRGRLGQRRHRDAVRVGSRRPPYQFLQQRMRAVGQFQQADVGDDAEAAFDQRQQARQQKPGQGPAQEVADAVGENQPPGLVGQQPGGDGHGQEGGPGDGGHLHELGARADAAQQQHRRR